MKKHYTLFLTLLFFALASPLLAQEVFWVTANTYQGSNRLITALSETGNVVASPIPANNDDLWGDVRPQLYRGSDGTMYGFTKNAEGTLLYRIMENGIHPIYQYEYGTFGPMAEGDPGNFYSFSSGADGNYVVIERVNRNGEDYKKYGFYKAAFRPQRLLNSNGVLFGVSNAGGTNAGSGYIFKFTPTDDLKNFQVLFNFSSTNGRKPVGALAEGIDGYLYGVTATGGLYEGGVIYKIRKDGTGFTKLYDFSYTSGRYPETGLVADEAGWLYGRTSSGTANQKGAIFKIRYDGSGFQNINTFTSASGENMGDLAYYEGYLYFFHRASGQTPAVLKLEVDGGWSYFHIFPETSLFEGHSIIVDPQPKRSTIHATMPADGGTVVPIDVRFEFTPVVNASKYYFELSFTPDFATLDLRGESSQPFHTETHLRQGRTYYMRVKSNVWPNFGPTTSFKTTVLNAYNPRISVPKDGAIDVAAPSTKVTAGLISEAKRYTIELSTTPDFATKLVRTSKVDYQRTMVFDSLKYATKYYARFKTDITYYGRVSSFTTQAETFPALSPSVAGRSDVGPMVVDLVVEPSRPDMKRFTIQLSTSSVFTTTPLEVKSIQDFQSHHVIKGLRYATRYFVRIKSNINENWSATYSFRTRDEMSAKQLWGVTTAGGKQGAGTVFSYGLTSNKFTKHYDYDPITPEEGYEYYDYGEALQGSMIHGADDKLYFHSSTKESSAYGGSLFQVDNGNYVSHVQEIGLHYGNMTLASNNIVYTSVNSHLGPGVIDSYEIHSDTWKRIRVFTRSNGVDPGSELVELSDGFLYGRATEGGVNNRGTLYRIRHDGSGFEVTYLFSEMANGSQPTGDLAFGNDGFFYGTTRAGGAFDQGVVFKVRPDGSDFTKLYDFNGLTGSSPMGGVIIRGDIMFGTTSSGGAYGHGTVFRLYTSGSGFVKLHDFAGNNGSTPIGRLTWHGSELYGMTSSGGTSGKGTIFKISQTGVGFTVLHNFDGVNGAYPDGHLIIREDLSAAAPLAMLASEEESAMVEVSPNPSTSNFAISMKNAADEKVFISITDMNGYIVHESALTLSESQRVGDGLPRGIYILKARVNERTTMLRLVKK